MRTPLIVLSFFIALTSYGQVPVIQKVEPLTTFPGDTVVISGNGFNTTAANNEVWFEGVQATVLDATEYSIMVVVPAQAKYGPITVANLGSKLVGRSGLKFTPSMPINGFDIAKFVPVRTIGGTEEFWDLCYCDLNSDGKQDIATTKFKRTSPFPTPTDLMILQNTSTLGNINFLRKDKSNLGVLNLGFSTDNVVCGDLNGDGKPDLVATRGTQGSRNSLHIFRNTSTTDVNFALPTALFMDVGHFATRLAIRDLNRDGKPEIIATNSFNDVFYIYVNISSGVNLLFNSTPIKLSIKLAEGEVLTTYETDVQDFDGDNLPDIIINQFQTDNFYILKNQSTGSIDFGTPQKFLIEGSLNRLISADLNKDGLLDAIFTSTLDDEAYVFINKSTQAAFAFNSPIELKTSFEPWGLEAADIDGDTDVDIIINNRNRPIPDASARLINVFRNDGASSPSFVRSDIPIAMPGRNVRVGDLDGDGKPDIAYTSFDEAAVRSEVVVLENNNCFQPRILNAGPLTICAGQTLRLEGIPAANVTYTWKESGVAVAGTSHYLDITTPGTYTVTATGEGGLCEITSAPIVVTNDAASTPPTPDITAIAPVCVGSNMVLATSVTADSYLWTGPGGQTYTAKTQTITADNEDAGLYTLQVKVGNCKSPEAELLVDVVDLTDFSISTTATSELLCQGSPVTLSVNNLTGYSFQWKKDAADISGATTATLSVTASGEYGVRVTPPGDLNCPVIEADPVGVAFVAPPVSAFEVKAVACLNETITFTNQSTVDPAATAIYTWTFGDSGTSPDQNPTHAYATAGTVTPSLAVRYDGVSGCTNSTAKNITIANAVVPVIESSVESACPDEMVTLSVDGTFTSFTWSTNATGPTTEVSPGAYTVETADVNGCIASDDHLVVIKEVPILTVSADPPEIPLGATSQLTATGAVTYDWSPGSTLSDSTISSPVAKPVTTTLYTLIGTSSEGCDAVAQLAITVEGVLGFPVAFSPNGDGQNEIWDIQAEFNPECTISIFDGRGRKVFEAAGENWDGTYNGSEAPEGTYYFVYTCPDGKPRTGSILLFR